MYRILKKSMVWAFGVISIVFTFFLESFWGNTRWHTIEHVTEKFFNNSDALAVSITINKILGFLLLWVIVFLIYLVREKCRSSLIIKGADYVISVEYGDLLKMEDSKRVITFDECFTISVSDTPGDIKPNSLCGQYLQSHRNLQVASLAKQAEIKPERKKSLYKNKDRYNSGIIVPNGDDLLMAFAKLDSSGCGMFPSLIDYIECLFVLWEQINKHYAQHDVCIPIMGAGLTRIGNGASYTAQQLLDIIIWTYSKSPHKIKKPYKLRIICTKEQGLSLSDINAE